MTRISSLAFITLAITALPAFAQKKIDPLPSFKKLAIACQAQARSWPPDTVRLVKDQWVRNFLEVGSISHDVKRTDSLISPFTAYIKVESVSHSIRRATEDEARAAGKQDGSTYRRTDVLHYAFQDSKWKLVNGSTQGEMRLPGEADFKDPVGVVKLDASDISNNPRWAGCVP